MAGLKQRLALFVGVFVASMAFGSAPAAAQATRTYVSGVGDDANPCSRTAPCKTFAGTISKTATGGEINCLDPAGYGTVTIVKSITIDCTGTFGSVLSSSTTGIIVNGADINVILRALSVNGAPPSAPGINGIRVLQANSVLIDNVKIFGFASAVPNGYGVLVNPQTNPSSGTTSVTVVNSSIANNQGGGIGVIPQASVAIGLAVRRTDIVNSGVSGVEIDTSAAPSATVKVSVADSLISGAGASTSGFISRATTGTVSGSITGSVITNNATGLRINGGTFVVGSTVITGNNLGVKASGGTANSFGNNMLGGNTTDGSFSGTTPAS